MFETLTDKLQRAFKNLRGQGKLSEEHLDAGLAEIREALLEGDVNVGVGNVPAGVTVEAPAMAASQPVVPVLFSAKTDAPMGGSLATVTGKPVDEKLKIPSSFG